MKHLPWMLLLLAGCADTIDIDAVNETTAAGVADAPRPTKVPVDGVWCEKPIAADGAWCKKPIAADEKPVVIRRPCGCLGMHTFQPGVCRKCSQPTPFLEHKYCDGCTGNR